MDLLSTHPIKTSDLGFHGNLFGGTALAWMDASAVSYAMRPPLSGKLSTRFDPSTRGLNRRP
jgi:hypothetical protein